MKVSDVASLYLALAEHLRVECRKQSISLDTYDPDFILSSVMTWLGERDLALTEKGVRKIRSVR